ncbi:MAG: DUF1285 domain-containing protein [Granulosicoccus sp.]
MSDQQHLDAIAKAVVSRGLPPVHSWNPTRTGEIDIRISRDGQWWYNGSPIHRKRMVRLFSTVLRVDDDDETYLVTPYERLRITVEDAPFIAVLLEQGSALIFTTNVGDRVVADGDHPIRVHYKTPDAEPSPYVLVRDRLQALISRGVFIELGNLAEERDGQFGVESCGCFMPLAPVD